MSKKIKITNEKQQSRLWTAESTNKRKWLLPVGIIISRGESRLQDMLYRSLYYIYSTYHNMNSH